MAKENADAQTSRKPRAGIPTAFCACDDGTLMELVFQPEARKTFLAVWREDRWALESEVKANTGECLVPYSPNNNLIKNEALLLPSEPEEYGSIIALLSAIQGFIHQYVDVSPIFEKIASYYVLFTWVYDAFNELPYLRLRGDFGTGKTRFLLTVGSLCYKPFFASGASTVSPIFHTLNAFRGTLIIDEADFRLSDEKADIVKILNSGNVKGMPILRTVVNMHKEFNPQAFHVYGPKIVATRGYYEDRALESRFITEELGSRPLRVDIPISLPSSYKAEARALRNKLLLYRFRNLNRVEPNAELVDRDIEPRLNQVFVPLLSVVEEEAIRNELHAVARAYNEVLLSERSVSIEGQLLEVVRDLFAERSGGVAVKEIAARFRSQYGDDVEQAITPKWVGTALRRRLNLMTRKSHGVFVVPFTERHKLDALCTRFGIEYEPANGADRRLSELFRVDLGDIGDVGAG